jgi:hypothetical protein
VDEIDDVAYVLFIGEPFEAFFRESDDGAEALCELSE